MIVNADDLGYSSAVNSAILESMIKGYCTHATIMANMPGFEEACQLVRENGLTERVGIHWVLSEGTAVTEAAKRCPRLCDADGRFRLTRSERVVHLSAGDRQAAHEELIEQLAICRRQGLTPRHADSHKHAHEEWALVSVVIGACWHGGVGLLRIARNIGPDTGRLRAAYRAIVNCRIRRSGLARTRFFGSWADFEYARARGVALTDDVEVMVHPQYGRKGLLEDVTCGLPLSRMLMSVAE